MTGVVQMLGILACLVLAAGPDWCAAAPLHPQFMAVCPVGGESAPPGECAAVVFRPRAAGIFCSAPGDYVQRCRNGTLLLYKCVAVPRAPGMRATHDVLGMTGGIIDGRHSDRRYRFWSKSTAKDNMLVERSPSDPPGAVLARTSFFNEPLLYTLSNIRSDSSPTGTLSFAVRGVSSGALCLSLKNQTMLVLERVDSSRTVLFRQVLSNNQSQPLSLSSPQP